MKFPTTNKKLIQYKNLDSPGGIGKNSGPYFHHAFRKFCKDHIDSDRGSIFAVTSPESLKLFTDSGTLDEESRLKIVDVDKLPFGVLDFKASDTEKLMLIDAYLAIKASGGANIIIKHGAKPSMAAKTTLDNLKNKEIFKNGNIGVMSNFLSQYQKNL